MNLIEFTHALWMFVLILEGHNMQGRGLFWSWGSNIHNWRFILMLGAHKYTYLGVYFGFKVKTW
jgi:hypothetical protein